MQFLLSSFFQAVSCAKAKTKETSLWEQVQFSLLQYPEVGFLTPPCSQAKFKLEVYLRAFDQAVNQSWLPDLWSTGKEHKGNFTNF